MSRTASPLLVLTGPTGVGKTALAMQLADQFPLALISADSVMVYRCLDIGSAKPSASELASYPHALVNQVEPEHAYDAGQFVIDARLAIRDALERGRIPCLVGGTILYLKALLDGLDALPAADPVIRQHIRDQASVEGWPAIHALLAARDPEVAAMIHPNHSSRIERALEVLMVTGESIREHWTGETQDLEIEGVAMNISTLVLLPEDRDALKTRLDQRFETMLLDGLIEEVITLRTRPGLTPDCPSMRSVGYRQVWQYLDQEIDATTMKETAQAATRQLAKRQLTWLRSWPATGASSLMVGDHLPTEAATSWTAERLHHVL